MAKNTLKDLRDHLFETIERLKDEDEPMRVATALAVTKVAGAIIDSAKVEVEMARVLCSSEPGDSKFFGLKEESRELPQIAEKPTYVNGGVKR